MGFVKPYKTCSCKRELLSLSPVNRYNCADLCKWSIYISNFFFPCLSLQCCLLCAFFSSVFGSQLDIHSGGIDLAFPHHENEIAQSEAYHQCGQWANYFLHSGKPHPLNVCHLNLEYVQTLSVLIISRALASEGQCRENV